MAPHATTEMAPLELRALGETARASKVEPRRGSAVAAYPGNRACTS